MSILFNRTTLSLALLSIFSVSTQAATPTNINASTEDIEHAVATGETIGTISVAGGHSATITGEVIDIGGSVTVTTADRPTSTASSLSIGTDATESVTVSVETGNAFNTSGSDLTVNGKKIYIHTASDNTFGGYGVTTIGSTETEYIEFSGGDYGLSLLPYYSKAETDGKVTLTAKEVKISAKEAGIWAQNNSTGHQGHYAPIVVNADNIHIASDGIGIVAMSQGKVELNGNTYVKAPDAILARGESIVTINKDKNKTVQLDGNIDFNYDEKTSGTGVDADVTVNLVGTDSYWNGNAITSYTAIHKVPSGDILAIDNLNVTLSEGASWNVAAVQETCEDKEVYDKNNNLLYKYAGTGQAAVTNLTLNKGTVNLGDNVAKIKNLVIEGWGNKVLVADSSSNKNQFVVNSINFKEGSELITNLNTAYKDITYKDENVLTAANAKITGTITAEGDATLTITDDFTYSTTGLTALTSAYDGLTLNLLNASLAEGEEAVLTDGCIQTTEEVSTTVTPNTSGEAVVEVKNSGGQSLIVKNASEAPTVSSVVFSKKDSASGSLTLIGTTAGGILVKNAADQAIDVTVDSGITLNLGTNANEAETSGAMANVTLAKDSKLTVQNMAVSLEKLATGERTVVTIGNESRRGSMSVGTLNLASNSTIYLDPAWSGNAALDRVANASHLAVSAIDAINGNIYAGRNSLVALGTSAADAVDAFERLCTFNAGMNWGENGVSAALYVATPINVAGSIVVDGSKTSLNDFTGTSNAQQTVTIAAHNLLMVDQTALGSQTAINGTLSLDNGSYVGLVHANEGTIKLANKVNVAQVSNVDVVTDNPFISASLSQDGSSVAANFDATNGLSALASTGLQAMTRRADSTLARTIADRTSIDQELNAGINLWVDVTGEQYQADGFDNNAEFKADMGYGTFGGDVAFGAFTAGAAFQYGTGSLRSSVSNIKNSIDNYAVSLYGTYKVTDAFKMAAELAYVWGENDIFAEQAALNQSVDTEMYSFGLRAMYELTAGNFSLVPSIGLRISQLSTDAIHVGSVRVEDQDQTLVQVPLAVRINASEFNASGWSVAPSFKIAYVPTFGDKDINVLNYSQDVIDTSPVQADLGVRIGKGNMMFNVNMLLGAGEYGSSAVGGKVGFKYAF